MLNKGSFATTDVGHSDRARRSLPVLVLSVLFAVTAAAPFSGSGPVVFTVGLLATLYTLLYGRWLPLPFAVVLFLAWCLISLLWTVSASLTFRGLLATGLISLATSLLVGQLPRASVFWALRAALKTLVALSWLMYAAVPSLGREQVAYHRGALRGVFIQRNTAAFVLTIAVLTFLAAWLLACQRRERLSNLGWTLASVATLLATQSGTGLIVSSMSSILLFGLVRATRRGPGVVRTYLLLVSFAATLLALASQTDLNVLTGLLGRDSTLTGRTFIWATVEPYIEARPWLGYGWAALWTSDVFVTRQMWASAGFAFPHAHNSYLDLLAQVGIVGLVLVIAIFIATLIKLVRNLARIPHGSDAWALVVTIALLVYGSVEQSFMSYFGWMLVLVVATLANHPARSCAHAAPSATSGDRCTSCASELKVGLDATPKAL
jgi:exopolysaccharide production protein ExoQ